MPLDPFEQMQKAVDIVNTSLHPDNKIAATLAGEDRPGRYFSLSYTNYWPPVIENTIGHAARIGNSSGTVHAETAVILASAGHGSAGTSLFVTDPFCPNCAKNIAEAGIAAIYIDHKGFGKDFAVRRGDHFESMSLRLCEKAGINVFEIRRRDRDIKPIVRIPERYKPFEDSPVKIERLKSADDDTFREVIAEARKEHRGRRFATALARDSKNGAWSLVARAHPALGYSMSGDKDELEKLRDAGKYSFILEPVNRLLMNATRRGLKLVDGLVFSSGIPTSREQVNMAGANIKNIYIGDMLKARDDDCFRAMEVTSRNNIISFQRFS